MNTPNQTKELLDEIASRNNGVLLPEEVVKTAEDPNHPLHQCFEWNDAAAGHAHRLDQARTLIRTVKYNTSTTTQTIESVYYVRDPRLTGREQGYLSIPRLRTDTELAAMAVAQEFARAVAILERARNVSAALGMQKNIISLIRELKKIADQIPPVTE